VLFRLDTFDNATFFYFLTKQATLMRSSTVLSLPLQLVFPVKVFHLVLSSTNADGLATNEDTLKLTKSSKLFIDFNFVKF
jgi:hypothetical protein